MLTTSCFCSTNLGLHVHFKTVKTGLTISVSIQSCDEWENCWLLFCWANSLTSVLTTTHTHMYVRTFHIASTICNAHTLFSCILLSTLCLTHCPPGHIHYLPLGAMHTHHKCKEYYLVLSSQQLSEKNSSTTIANMLWILIKAHINFLYINCLTTHTTVLKVHHHAELPPEWYMNMTTELQSENITHISWAADTHAHTHTHTHTQSTQSCYTCTHQHAKSSWPPRGSMWEGNTLIPTRLTLGIQSLHASKCTTPQKWELMPVHILV